MADLTAIENALAAQITAQTGLRGNAQARDQISPPAFVLLPREPSAIFGMTMDGTVDINMTVMLILSDAPPLEKTLRAQNQYMSVGSLEPQSIANAIMTDTTLGGVVHWCIPVSVSSISRIVYNDVTYFGGRVGVSIGAI